MRWLNWLYFKRPECRPTGNPMTHSKPIDSDSATEGSAAEEDRSIGGRGDRANNMHLTCMHGEE